ncbi:hypothetical protein VSAK1_18779 [Vibrio mediterranei AK1]|nr:hypothetical protein VSAK1_18779 [Vibrio mediterranei AK1]
MNGVIRKEKAVTPNYEKSDG